MAAPATEQLNILCERYLEIVLADRGSTFILLLQAPVIALLTVLNWRGVDTVTDSLFYVLALSALWFGTLNACREVVKERPILEREARRGLKVGPYLLSKVMVLALLSFVQCFCLAFVVDHYLPLGGPAFFHFFFLWLTSLGGISLGLFLSSLMSNSDRAVGAVVLVLIPQMLFSEMVISHDHAADIVLWAEDFSFISWCFQGLKEVTQSEWAWLTLLQSGFMLLLLSLGLLTASYGLLRWRLRRVAA